MNGLDTSSSYVVSLFDNKVIYNMSNLAVSAGDNSNGRKISEDVDGNKYYWTIFDYPENKGNCGDVGDDSSIITSYVYQTNTNGDVCYGMGSDYNVILYDPYNAVNGITINYTQGSTSTTLDYKLNNFYQNNQNLLLFTIPN